jgi:SpoVK/Ycf46/Vps4 family AAA+-type ATPase
MGYDVGVVINAINEVDENIWLGDYKKAKEIADLNLADLEKDVEIYQSQALARDLRRIIRESKKDAREKKIEDVDSWITERIIERMKDAERKPIDNLVGILIIHLTSLRDMLEFLIKSRAQKTLGSSRENQTGQEEILRMGEKCRFTIRSLPDRWEVRAILDEPARQWNLNELKNRLPDFGFSASEVSKDRLSGTLQIFSRELYADILVQERQIEFSVRSAKKEEIEDRIQKLMETVTKSLVT